VPTPADDIAEHRNSLMLFVPFLVARVFPETSGRTLEDIAPER